MNAPSPNDERFDAEEVAGTPLMEAAEKLTADANVSLDALQKMTMGEILQLAEKTYGAKLPDFWKVWKDWSGPDQVQPMGDL